MINNFTIQINEPDNATFYNDRHLEIDWKTTMVETGENAQTGARLRKIRSFVEDDRYFMLTYGDGLADININKLIDFHKSHGKAITMTSSQLKGRFGALAIDENERVLSFQEKPKGDGQWVNAGFFVCEPKVFDFIEDGDKTIFERDPLENLAKAGELYTYKHAGFWKPMDTLWDKMQLEEMVVNGKAEWIKW